MNSSARLPNRHNSVTASDAGPALGSTVDAAALQNEMAKKYGLTASTRPKRRPRRADVSSDEQRDCVSCGCRMINISEYCESCGYIPDTRAQDLESLQQQNSLAHRRCLVRSTSTSSGSKMATEPLKPLDWYLLEKSILKKVDPDACCPICMESFRASEEVLLSCGHIFHKICLRSFENFIRNGDYSCPICRTKNYQKKVTNLGTVSHQKLSARRIQALWRGFQARLEYRHLLRSHYKSGQENINKGLQRRFYQQEVTSLAAKLDSNMTSRAAKVDILLNSMERTLDDSRQLDRLFEDMLRHREQNRQPLGLPPVYPIDDAAGDQRRDFIGGILTHSLTHNLPPTSISSGSMKDEANSLDNQPVRLFCGNEFCVEHSVPWSQVHEQAVSRGHCDCAICMLPVSTEISNLHEKPHVQEKASKVSSNVKYSVLLSCSHVFHQQCIGNFEMFTRHEGTYNCPVCRGHYSKRLL